jgi:hypothetical protein
LIRQRPADCLAAVALEVGAGIGTPAIKCRIYGCRRRPRLSATGPSSTILPPVQVYLFRVALLEHQKARFVDLPFADGPIWTIRSAALG